MGVFLGCWLGSALASGFVLPPDSKQAFVKLGRDDRLGPSVLAGHRKIAEIFIQAGLPEKLAKSWMADAKFYSQNGAAEGRKQESYIFELALLRDAPYLANGLWGGLLPPFSEKLLRYLMPSADIHRRKGASIGIEAGYLENHYNLPNRRESDRFYGVRLSLADRIDVGRLALFQQVIVRNHKHKDTDTQIGEYKVELGWKSRFWLGNEALFFRDSKSGYQDLKHWRYLRWQPHGSDWQISLARGKLRWNDTGQIAKRIKLEISVNF